LPCTELKFQTKVLDRNHTYIYTLETEWYFFFIFIGSTFKFRLNVVR